MTNPMGLTDRELSVLRAMGKGLSNDDIAKETGIPKGLVRQTVSVLMKKIGASNRTQCVLNAMSLCIIPMPKIAPLSITKE